MKTLKVTLRGIAPILLHNNDCVNPTHPLTLAKKKLTSKRKRTEEDELAILDVAFRQAIYWSEKVGVFIPSRCIEACFRDAAKKNKLGKAATQAVYVEELEVPLDYGKDLTLDELVADPHYRDVRAGKVNNSQILVCRPRFDDWKIKFSLTFDETIFDAETIAMILENAGRYIGLCDYRPKYGKFVATIE